MANDDYAFTIWNSRVSTNAVENDWDPDGDGISVDYVNHWTGKTKLPAKALVGWLEIGRQLVASRPDTRRKVRSWSREG